VWCMAWLCRACGLDWRKQAHNLSCPFAGLLAGRQPKLSCLTCSALRCNASHCTALSCASPQPGLLAWREPCLAPLQHWFVSLNAVHLCCLSIEHKLHPVAREVASVQTKSGRGVAGVCRPAGSMRASNCSPLGLEKPLASPTLFHLEVGFRAAVPELEEPLVSFGGC